MVREQAPAKVPLRPITANEDARRPAETTSHSQGAPNTPNKSTAASRPTATTAATLPFDEDWFEDGRSPAHSQSQGQNLLDRFNALSLAGSQSKSQDGSAAPADASLVEISPPKARGNLLSSTGTGSSQGAKNNPYGGGAAHKNLFGSSSSSQGGRGKAGVFVKQTRRPEHHRDDRYRISAPTAAKAADIPAAAPKMFSSADAFETKPFGHYEPGQEFYTDPKKAASDLKALLEGGMDEEEEEEGRRRREGSAGVEEKKSKKMHDGTLEGLNVKLLPHQVEGVEWMKGRELGPVKRGKVPRGGILADDMGLGKTLQKDDVGRRPLALIRQWEAEIKEKVAKTHQLKVYVHHGPQRTKSHKELALYDVVVTTYQTLVSEHGHSSSAADGPKAGCFGVNWWRVILDEAHSIKNRNAKATKACCALSTVFRWCLTGTPMQNNLDELQSLIHFLRIQPYDDLKEWRDHIDQPMKNGKGGGRAEPGGKPSEPGEESATGFKVTERKVVDITVSFSPAEKRFYGRLQARADKSLERMLKGRVNYANALVLLLRLRQVCNHPKLVEGKLEKDRDALSTGSGTGGIGKEVSQTAMDDLADLFASASIQTKSCGICGYELGPVDSMSGRDTCQDCYDDLAYFNDGEDAAAKNSGKRKTKQKEKGGSKDRGDGRRKQTEAKTLRRRGARKVIVDSDDEDEEEADGSWLVPEDQRGALRLGKAGGEEDENAEGGGDWIGSDDSIHKSEAEEEGSQLDSFIVPDHQVPKDSSSVLAAYKTDDDDDDDDDDSFPSVQELCSQRSQSRTVKGDETGSIHESSSGSEDDDDTDSDAESVDTGIDEADIASGSDDDEPSILRAPRRKGGTSQQVLASAKIRRLVKILHKEVHEHKFIVFSQFTSMLDLVEPFFEKEGFKYTRYDGGMKNDEREESLHRLRNDKNTRILLCSLKCGSLGLNLTAATRVVILEPFWNPFIEEQAIDRVHRLTQKIDVVVYKLTVGGAFKLGIKEMLDLFKHEGSADYVGTYEQGPGDEDAAGGNGSPFLRAHVQNALSIVWTTALPLSSSPATLAARILQHHLPAYASHTYIDFCAGGGGPTPEIERVLNAGLRRRRVGDATFVMTDLHPNPRSVDARDGGDVVRKWVDKGRAEGRWPVGAPGARDGARVCRLFNLAFHHFDDALAGDIVKDTVETSHAFAIFELQDRHFISFIPTLLLFPATLLLAPLYALRQRSLSALLFTYLIPIIPFVLVFDGWMSGLRTRTPDEVEAMLRRHGGPEAANWTVKSGREMHLWPCGAGGSRVQMCSLIPDL
ncbi:unnamed protein product [Parascedosporium putredinis]|uniref:Uncharacterized protein n=1 Tax=Parascedosporium putredinis TaxID=1442378 RepID=A0A9P1H515_9PEZI|nr:unnamed protein product [Parascedosporium putredinis]CAI7996073.1 unnamed protein product [Parascedosporium putredinis]